jgi:hypothetical protein
MSTLRGILILALLGLGFEMGYVYSRPDCRPFILPAGSASPESGRLAERLVSAAQTAWSWEAQKDKSLALLGPAGVLWQFRYDPALDVPYFHPLNTIDGRLLTGDSPPDHIWHHGLWFSWKFINKVNYWEIDAKTGRPEGRTTWSDVETLPRDDFSARIAMALSYRPAGESKPVMTEERTIEVSRPDEAGAYSLDWASTFTALEAVVLDRTPPPNEPGGQSWGGYSGLSVRFAKDAVVRKVVTSDGPIIEFPDNRYRGKHTAMDYSGLFGGHPAGIAICDHPDNPGSPTPWYAIREPVMSFFNAAVICYSPITLEPGQKLTLRYRVLVHPGRFDADRLRAEYDRFAAMPPR